MGKKKIKKNIVVLGWFCYPVSHCDYEALITSSSMIADRIGRHEVLLPINHNFNKICDI